MVTFFIALLITIILAQWCILWLDKAFFAACVLELGEQAKIIEFLEEQVAAQQDAMQEAFEGPTVSLNDYIPTYAPVDTPFLDTIGQGTVVNGPWSNVGKGPRHTQEDTFQPARS